MRRMLRDEALQRQVESSGWGRLPRLDPATIDQLRAIARAGDAAVVGRPSSADVGFDELWASEDQAARVKVQQEIRDALQPMLDGVFQDVRPVLFNIFMKRAKSASSRVRFHRDLAFIDERRGEVALQLWIPLVEVGPGNGALILVDRSHLGAEPIRALGYLDEASQQPGPPPGAVALELEAGAGVVFTQRTMHGSPPNLTAEERPAIGCVLAPQGVPLIQWVESDAGFELFRLGDADLLRVHPEQALTMAERVELVPRPR